VAPEAYRIECHSGHVLVMTKAGDENVETSVIGHFGKCLYCGDRLKATPANLHEFNAWASREDGRWHGDGAP
jgi:hypothetical protein